MGYCHRVRMGCCHREEEDIRTGRISTNFPHAATVQAHGGLQQGRGRRAADARNAEQCVRDHGVLLERRRWLARSRAHCCFYSFHLDGLGFRPHSVCLQTQWNDKDLDALLNESDEDEPVPTRYANHLRSPSVHACWFMSDLCSVAARRARLGAAAPTTGNPVALPR
jgi:hypothetical protein